MWIILRKRGRRLVFSIKNPIFLHHYFVNVLKLGTWIFFPYQQNVSLLVYKTTSTLRSSKICKVWVEAVIVFFVPESTTYAIVTGILLLSLHFKQKYRKMLHAWWIVWKDTTRYHIYKPVSYIALHDCMYYLISLTNQFVMFHILRLTIYN